MRSDESVWVPFGAAVGDRNRALWLNEFMRWVNRDPELWQDVRRISARKGDDLGGLIEAMFRRYRQRNITLLDD